MNGSTKLRAQQRPSLFTLTFVSLLLAGGWIGLCPSRADATKIRVVTYNIDDDTGGAGGVGPRTPMADLATILKGIGDHHLANGNAQPIDVLALQETHYDNPNPSSSLSAIANQLNSIYGAGTYSFSTFIDATTGNLTGNGPSGLVYNTKTISVSGALGIGTASGSGAPRQPARFQLHPVGFASGADFYMYVSHMKAGTDTPPSTSNETRRNIEAQNIRANADTLGSSAHILYVGDYNLAGQGDIGSRTQLASQEPCWQTFMAAGNGHANDISGAPANWDNTPAFANLMTWDTGNGLIDGDDHQLVTDAVLNQIGLKYLGNAYEYFGNNGSLAYGSPINAGGNTALSDLPNRTTILNLMSTVTDHIPVVVDYDIVGIAPEPGTATLIGIVTLLPLTRRHRQHS